MKLIRRVTMSFLIVLFFSAGFAGGQNTAEQILTKGLEYAAQGKYKEAKKELGKVSKDDENFSLAESGGCQGSCHLSHSLGRLF